LASSGISASAKASLVMLYQRRIYNGVLALGPKGAPRTRS
jgi:hypothetical protein